MNEIIAVAVITTLAVISPGPDFAAVTRNSYLYGTRTGLFSALGIAFGVQVHVIYTVFGITLLIMQSPLLFTVIKSFGIIYLVWLGFKSFTNKTRISVNNTESAALSAVGAFRNGFFVNALNPKTMFFVVSVYTQVISSHNSLLINFSYGLFISFVHLLWFSLIALFFSNPVIRNKILNHQLLMDKVIGVLLMLLGISLVFFTIN
ncbi:LysE family translocator [Morganella psychrotolerans]|uniref:LysE family translocator n=1 Tax=Morganella psychrotolerans TaxID=368603 RepID=A0A5M9R4J1_9GAMM|nr:LysE family translocator [Morganella psychrotolerans]KAA8714826.1 LysE family translocator [Morganella psychrotolerans]OBU04560.1 lysine transporter LysE [Morganella psychrotolerans]